MFKVAQRAGAAEVAEQRRQEALRAQQEADRLRAQQAAQAAGFQQQEKMLGLQQKAHEADREDQQAYGLESMQAQQKFQAERDAAQAKQREQLQLEYEARFAERAKNNQMMEMMQKSGHPKDATDFAGLIASRDKLRAQVASRSEGEYQDVLKDQLIDIERQITDFMGNGEKYKVPSPEEQADQDSLPVYLLPNGQRIRTRTPPPEGSTYIGEWSVAEKKMAWTRNQGEKESAEEKQAKAKEAQDKKDAAEYKLDRDIYEDAMKRWDKNLAAAKKSALTIEQSKKPVKKPDEEDAAFLARREEWQSGLEERVEAAAMKKMPAPPEEPIKPNVRRELERRADADALASMTRGAFARQAAQPNSPQAWPEGQVETGSTPMMGDGPQGGAPPAAAQQPPPPEPAPAKPEAKQAYFEESWPKEGPAAADKPKAEKTYDLIFSNPKRAKPDYRLADDPEFIKLWDGLSPAARQILAAKMKASGVLDEERGKVTGRNPASEGWSRVQPRYAAPGEETGNYHP